MADESEREMTPEYAALSYRFGRLADLADQYLDSDYAARTRATRWSFSEERYQALRTEVIRRGIPADLLAENEADWQAYLKQNLSRLVGLQAKYDSKRNKP